VGRKGLDAPDGVALEFGFCSADEVDGRADEVLGNDMAALSAEVSGREVIRCTEPAAAVAEILAGKWCSIGLPDRFWAMTAGWECDGCVAVCRAAVVLVVYVRTSGADVVVAGTVCEADGLS
jgi:hypothetical protein